MSTYRKRKHIEDDSSIFPKHKKIESQNNIQTKSDTLYFMNTLANIYHKIDNIEKSIAELKQKINSKLVENNRIERKLDLLDKKLTDMYDMFKNKNESHDIETIIDQLKTINIFEEKKTEKQYPINNYQMSYIN